MELVTEFVGDVLPAAHLHFVRHRSKTTPPGDGGVIKAYPQQRPSNVLSQMSWGVPHSNGDTRVCDEPAEVAVVDSISNSCG